MEHSSSTHQSLQQSISSHWFYRNSERLIIATVSLALTIYLILIDDVINRDGALYMRTAQAFLDNGISGAIENYGWPFYSIVIACISKVTTLSLQTSAFFFNTFCLVILCDSLYRIIALAFSKQTLTRQYFWVALLVICLPTLSDYRSFIIRDIPYLACLFTAFYYLFRYHTFYLTRDAFIWQALIMLGFLFRVDAGIFPLISFFSIYLAYKKKPFLRNLFDHSTLFLIGGIAGVLFIILSGNFEQLKIAQYFQDNAFTRHFIEMRSGLEKVLPIYSQDDSTRILGWGLLSLIPYLAVRGVTIPYLIYSLYAEKKCTERTSNPAILKLIIGLAILNFILLAIFVLQRGFLTQRYVLSFILLGMIFISLRLINYFETNTSPKWYLWCGFALLVFFIGDSLVESKSKRYVPNTLHWIEQQTDKPKNIFSTNFYLAYYLSPYQKHPNTAEAIKEQNLNINDWLVLEESDLEKLEPIKLKKIRQIYGRKNKPVNLAVYEIVSLDEK